MANQKQLEILKQGGENWNSWRKENPSLDIDLTGAYLSGANLAGTDLQYADFSKANLDKANLADASLIGAKLLGATFVETNLSKAKLRQAIFSPGDIRMLMDVTPGTYPVSGLKAQFFGADLREADMSKTDLSHLNFNDANLRGANLMKTDLSGANLTRANLSEAHMMKTDLSGTNLTRANLSGANLTEAILIGARLFEADLGRAILLRANLREADLSAANLRGADLYEANLREANLLRADFSDSNMGNANLVGAKVFGAKVSGSYVYGISVWDLEHEFEEQKNLIITSKGQPIITVDDIKFAQFVYLILNNTEIRDFINTLTSKSVLILGRFAISERKEILDALRNKLREYNLLPIVFDFERPDDKDFTETIKTLAGLSYFVIADVTNPKSSPLELQATVPDYQIPFVPIIQEGESPFAMMVDLQKKYNWVLNTVSYDSQETLIRVLKPLIIDPAMKKRQELRLIKAQEPEVISAKDFLKKGAE